MHVSPEWLAAPAAPEDATTRRILDAALEQVTAHGVRHTTMNQIAAAAGLGVATVYRRFPQKAELVRAVILREAEAVTAAVAAAMELPIPVPEQSAEGFTAFAHAVADRPLIVRLLRGDADRDGESVLPGDLVDQMIAMARDYVAQVIRRLQIEGRYLQVDADVVAEIQARLAMSLILSPDGSIPMHDDAATRAFAIRYLVPLMGPEH